MAEEGEVHYASVVFKTKKAKPKGRTEEETVYDEVKVRNETTEKNLDSNGLLANKETEKRSHLYQWSACCFGTVCVILLLGIIGVCVYLTFIHESESQLKSNQTALLAENSNLTKLNNKLTSDNENLTRNHNDLTVQMNNLTQAYDVLENKITNLTAENKNLSKQNQELNTQNQELNTQNQELNTQNQELNTQNQELNTQNQELEADRKNLTEQVENTEAMQVEFNISRAQWSIDAYCPKKDNARTCNQCEKGWIHPQSSCYAVNDHVPDKRRSWEGAREDCRGKGSDLVVVGDDNEKKTVSDYSWDSSGWNGFWIGLKAENGKWKWVDGSDLADNSWITQEPQDGRCVILVKNKEWKSVSCDGKQQWICEKAALSV
ncbi:uncharacterized protein PAE49_005839 isoform 3-T3 [Odontesthes bonariensis]|uniref:uncharacterized protein LOC142380853 isoform X3 n=1 Tax=Odontesthes bonariensis TaxID=219752 RepID=UPI003F58C19D